MMFIKENIGIIVFLLLCVLVTYGRMIRIREDKVINNFTERREQND